MARVKHLIRNATDSPQFVTFEVSTYRYRLNPGEEIFFYYPSEFPNPDEPPLITEFVGSDGEYETIIWINFGQEEGPFLPNGDKAVPDFG